MLCDNLEGRDGVRVGGRLKKEGMYAYLRLIHVVVWQKPTQHCKAATLQLNINFKILKLYCSNSIKALKMVHILFFFNLYFYFILLYNIVLVLTYIDMNPPWVYMSSQS